MIYANRKIKVIDSARLSKAVPTRVASIEKIRSQNSSKIKINVIIDDGCSASFKIKKNSSKSSMIKREKSISSSKPNTRESGKLSLKELMEINNTS